MTNRVIFKTFDSDSNKISSQIDVFGKSFNDIGEIIRQRKIDIDDLMISTGISAEEAAKQTKSIRSRLLPTKKEIQPDLIDVESLYPKMDDSQSQNLLNNL